MSDDLTTRAARTLRTRVADERHTIARDGWQGPTITPTDGNRPPIVDYSTWICPHDPPCGHPMPCWARYAKETLSR